MSTPVQRNRSEILPRMMGVSRLELLFEINARRTHPRCFDRSCTAHLGIRFLEQIAPDQS